MKDFFKVKAYKYTLYLFICVFIFYATNIFFGWLLYDYEWLYKDFRPAIIAFVLINLYIDAIIILLVDIEL